MVIFGGAYIWRDLFSEFYGRVTFISLVTGRERDTSFLSQSESTVVESETNCENYFHVFASEVKKKLL